MISFGGKDLVSQGNLDVYVAKFDAQGSPLWSIQAGDAAKQDARDVAVDPAGNIHLVGSFSGILDFGVPLSNSGSQRASVLSMAPTEAVAVAGAFEKTIDLGNGAATGPTPESSFVTAYDSVGSPGTSLTSQGSADWIA